MSGHAQREHAPLSPSKAEAWLACPAWVNLAADAPDSGSSAAAKEGTRLHELAEKHLRAGTTPEGSDAGRIIDYINYIRDVLEFFPDAKLILEERVTLVEDVVWGSCDCIIIDEASKRLWVVDLKTGTGHLVSPKENPQIGVYALAVHETFGLKPSEYTNTLAIVQEAAGGLSGSPEWEADAAWLAQLRVDVLKRAAEYKARQHHIWPPARAGDHCTWCPAKAYCPAWTKKAGEVFPVEQADGMDLTPRATHTLTPQEMSRVLDLAPAIREWISAVEALAHQAPPPGWKLVEGRSTRKVKDEAGFVSTLEERAIDAYEQKLISLTAAEKALGKEKAVLQPYLEKPPGKPTLAREDDPRPAFCPFEETGALPEPSSTTSHTRQGETNG